MSGMIFSKSMEYGIFVEKLSVIQYNINYFTKQMPVALLRRLHQTQQKSTYLSACSSKKQILCTALPGHTSNVTFKCELEKYIELSYQLPKELPPICFFKVGISNYY